MRIVFTGAQGTGKSTIMDLYKEYPHITGVCRGLAKKGVKINEMGDDESQALIFDTYYDLLTQNDNYISDRGLTDVLGYSKWLHENGRLSREELDREIELFDKFINNWDVKYFYFPIEFEVVNDGVRSTDEAFRKSVSNNILETLLINHIDYFTVTGTVAERKSYCDKIIQLLKTMEDYSPYNGI